MMCILANFIIVIKPPDKKALENYIYNTYICYGYSNEHMFKLMLIKNNNFTLRKCTHLDLIYNSKVSNSFFYRFNDSVM